MRRCALASQLLPPHAARASHSYVYPLGRVSLEQFQPLALPVAIMAMRTQIGRTEPAGSEDAPLLYREFVAFEVSGQDADRVLMTRGHFPGNEAVRGLLVRQGKIWRDPVRGQQRRTRAPNRASMSLSICVALSLPLRPHHAPPFARGGGAGAAEAAARARRRRAAPPVGAAARRGDADARAPPATRPPRPVASPWQPRPARLPCPPQQRTPSATLPAARPPRLPKPSCPATPQQHTQLSRSPPWRRCSRGPDEHRVNLSAEFELFPSAQPLAFAEAVCRRAGREVLPRRSLRRWRPSCNF